ncbi:ankyrin repeat-containing domain protein [Xylaria digitata]|nr:ankyrin repeat-containing domain protein [Xylaria digitata]
MELSDLEPNMLRGVLLKQAQTLQACFYPRFEDINTVEEIFEDWDHAAAEGMVARLSFKDRRNIYRVTEPAHKFLLAAARLGYESPFRQLARRGIDVNSAKTDFSLITLAAEGGNKRIVQTLLSLGAEVRQVDEGVRSALHGASSSGSADIARLLLDYGCEVDHKDNRGWTPLMTAASRGHKAVVQVLVEHGAGIEKKDLEGRTALIIAVTSGQQLIVKRLLGLGASRRATDDKGFTARDWAKRGRQGAMVKLLDASDTTTPESINSQVIADHPVASGFILPTPNRRRAPASRR